MTLDDSKEEGAAKLSVHCEHILRFLWVNATAQTVELVDPTHPQADNFYDECLQIIQPPLQPQNAANLLMGTAYDRDDGNGPTTSTSSGTGKRSSILGV